jgi:hypothetical protein
MFGIIKDETIFYILGVMQHIIMVLDMYLY